MRLLICAGGTGGGVYPALSVLSALQKKVKGSGEKDGQKSFDHAPLSILWVGGLGGMEADLVKRAGISFEAIPAAGVHGVGLRALPGNLARLGRGYREARRILQRFHPDVLFFTGGYVSVPVALAGRSIPSLMFVPDIEPGLALKVVGRFARQVAVTVEDSRAYFPAHQQVAVTGYPVRPELTGWTPASARQVLGLSDDLPTLLVFGGSKGSRSINNALVSALPELLSKMQVVHVTGQLDWPSVEQARARLSGSLAGEWLDRYHAFPYLHDEMGAAFTAADLVVARAGASTLGEFPLFELPAILVPYPYAWRYQQVNAQYLENHSAAAIVRDEELPHRLLPLILELIGDRDRLAGMRAAMHSLARPGAAGAIAGLLQDLAGEGGREHG